MPFEIPSDLHPRLTALAWMIGRWEGSGKSTYPGTDDQDFGQQIDFTHTGKDYLHYFSQTFTVDEDGLPVSPLSMETGFWRPQADGTVEVVMCHPSGIAEVWYGRIGSARVDLITDAVVRTASAEEYVAGQRLYGYVNGDLLWTFDKASGGVPLQSHIWAQLRRT